MDKLLDRIQKLLNQANDDSITIDEQDAFFAKASELMGKYGIDAAMLAAKAPGAPVQPTSRKFTLNDSYAVDQVKLWHVLGEAYNVQVIRLQVDGTRYDEYGNYLGWKRRYEVDLIGFPQDIEIVEMLYTSLYLQVSNRLKHVRGDEFTTTKTAKCNYFSGFTSSIKARVNASVAQAVADTEAEGTSTALVLVDRESKVTAKFKEKYPRITKTTHRRRVYGGHYQAGKEFGNKANLHDKSGVGNSSRGEIS